MRDPKRIDKFTNVLNYIWKTKCPDWRFFQLIENVFGVKVDIVHWMMEENEALEQLCERFDVKIEDVPERP